MGRILMCHEFRSHDMTRLTAKLRGLHMLDRPISQLGSNNQVKNSRDSREPRYATQGCLPIQDRFNACLQATFAKVDANGNQRQSSKENDRKNQKNDNPDVWIAGMTSNLQRQNK